MINNPYTIAADSVRAPAYAVENAIRLAKRRAARRASTRVKVGYAAAAASVVIAGTAGILLINGSGFEPPTSPSRDTQTASLSTRSSESAAKPTAQSTAPSTSQDPSEKTAGSSKPSEPLTESPSASEISHTQGESAVSPTQTTASATEKSAVPPTSKPTSKPAEKPTETESEMVEVSPIDVEVDSSRLSDDGKLYCVIAETGYDVNSDPDAFSENRVYYVETKFGRFKQPFGAWWVDSTSLDNLSYIFYNSDGIVVYTEPVSSR